MMIYYIHLIFWFIFKFSFLLHNTVHNNYFAFTLSISLAVAVNLQIVHTRSRSRIRCACTCLIFKKSGCSLPHWFTVPYHVPVSTLPAKSKRLSFICSPPLKFHGVLALFIRRLVFHCFGCCVRPATKSRILR